MRKSHSTSTSDLSPLWISITRRASRDMPGATTRSSAARHVFRFDGSGSLRQKMVGWRPFTPTKDETQVATLSLFASGRLLSTLEINTPQWQTIMAYGLEQFILEAAASRNFRAALAHSERAR